MPGVVFLFRSVLQTSGLLQISGSVLQRGSIA